MQDVNKSCGLGLGLGLQLTALPPPALASCYSAPATVLASASAWIIGTHAHLNLNCPKMIVHSRNKGPLSPFCPRPQKLLARLSLFIVAGTFLYAAYLWITAGHQGQGGGVPEPVAQIFAGEDACTDHCTAGLLTLMGWGSRGPQGWRSLSVWPRSGRPRRCWTPRPCGMPHSTWIHRHIRQGCIYREKYTAV